VVPLDQGSTLAVLEGASQVVGKTFGRWIAFLEGEEHGFVIGVANHEIVRDAFQLPLDRVIIPTAWRWMDSLRALLAAGLTLGLMI
jgi:hypothetical protein